MNGDRAVETRAGSDVVTRHVLVIANETAASGSLIAKLEQTASEGDPLVTVIAPVNQPSEGYVVYQDTRRASAGRRLDRTLETLRRANIRANGMVVETDPVAAVKDALAQLEPPVTEVIVSTHPKERSGWLNRNVVERIRKAAGEIPVDHVVAAEAAADGEANVLVVANQTLASAPLLEQDPRAGAARAGELPDHRAARSTRTPSSRSRSVDSAASSAACAPRGSRRTGRSRTPTRTRP